MRLSSFLPLGTPRSDSLCRLPKRLQRPLELEAVFQQRQIHMERLGANGLDLRDDGRERGARQRRTRRGLEILARVGLDDGWNARGSRDASKIGACGRSRGKAADREQAFIVEDEMEQVAGLVACQG